MLHKGGFVSFGGGMIAQLRCLIECKRRVYKILLYGWGSWIFDDKLDHVIVILHLAS